MALIKLMLVFGLVLASSALPDLGLGSFKGNRNVFVNMKQGSDPIIDQINQQTFGSREEKLTALTTALQAHAQSSQGPIISRLAQTAGIQYESMWINNQIYVKGVNSRFVSTFSSLFPSQIASIEDEQILSLMPFELEKESNLTISTRQNGQNTWGVQKVQAPSVWSNGNRGAGILVGVIDTGTRVSHQALASNYVGAANYGWFDPSRRTSTPNDDNGHGTHVTGTICGTGGIGVAPQAKWMSCRGCTSNGCTQSDLTACGQFMLCPTDTQGRNQNCARAPRIVSNSWGGGRSTWYNSIIRSWRSGGIIPVFSNGNSGPGCRTVGSPGDNPDVIGVGSSTINDGLSRFSSRGPAANSLIKPDVSAPGQDVRSSWNTGDTAYNTISGTSMACPHVSGVIALMLSAKTDLTYDQVKNNLRRGCVNRNLLAAPNGSCGPSGYPNNDYGQGVVNALNSVGL